MLLALTNATFTIVNGGQPSKQVYDMDLGRRADFLGQVTLSAAQLLHPNGLQHGIQLTLHPRADNSSSKQLAATGTGTSYLKYNTLTQYCSHMRLCHFSCVCSSSSTS
jgi:hypothetical protein